MNAFFIVAVVLNWVVVGVGCWLSWQLLRQNGRMLLRFEALEQRLEESQFGESNEPDDLPDGGSADFSPLHREPANGMRTGLRASVREQDAPESRFGKRSLTPSKIKRDGLTVGTPAPSFRLPRLDGGELSLEE